MLFHFVRHKCSIIQDFALTYSHWEYFINEYKNSTQLIKNLQYSCFKLELEFKLEFQINTENAVRVNTVF
jgi:hypothetical protein